MRHERVHRYSVKCYLLWVVAFAFLASACGGRGAAKVTGSATDGLQRVVLTDSLGVDTLHFGTVRAGEVVERTIALANLSERPLVVVTTDTSCGCLKLQKPTEPIEAGGSVAATMTFYSSGYNYFAPRAFYIVTSASMTPKKIVVTADME